MKSLVMADPVPLRPAVEGLRLRWVYRCHCGATFTAKRSNVETGRARTCGCSWHGGTDTALHFIWKGMKQRCYLKQSKSYPGYGGRGIAVCERWRNSFAAFREDMGDRPTAEHRLERIDNDGDYEPGNCRWATQAEQNRNQRRTRRVTIGEKTLCAKDWAAFAGISYSTVTSRLRRGLSGADLIAPVPARLRRGDHAGAAGGKRP